MISCLRNKNQTIRILIGFISAIIVSFIVFGILYYFAPTFNGRNGLQLLTNRVFCDEERICILYILSIETICIFLLPAIIMLFLIYDDVRLIEPKAKKSRHIPFWIISVLLVFSLDIPGINCLSEINTNLVQFFVENDSDLWLNYQKTQALVDNLISPNLLIICLLCMAIIPAICEEIFFRGFLQQLSFDIFKNKHLAIIITAIIFSILHGDIYNMLPRFILGLILGYIFANSKNILYPILAHALHNSLAIILTILPKRIALFPNFDTIGTSENQLILGIAGILLLAGYCFIVSRKKQ